MEGLLCPACHVTVRPEDYFCYNCGQNLRPKPLSTSFSGQLVVYLKSLLLPPWGVILGMRYLRQPDRRSKLVGWAAIILTVVILMVVIKLTMNMITLVNDQVGQQLQNYSL